MSPGERREALEPLLAELTRAIGLPIDPAQNQRVFIAGLSTILDDKNVSGPCEVPLAPSALSSDARPLRPVAAGTRERWAPVIVRWLTRNGAPWRRYAAYVPRDQAAPPLSAALSSIGCIVEGAEGLRGRLRDFSFDPRSGEIRYALVGVGGVFGFGERLVILSGQLLRFDWRRRIFAAPLTRCDVRRARGVTTADLDALGVVRLSHRLRAGVRDDDFTAPAH